MHYTGIDNMVAIFIMVEIGTANACSCAGSWRPDLCSQPEPFTWLSMSSIMT